jgi:RNA polymerase sigma-70 factor (ECF subfamily)
MSVEQRRDLEILGQRLARGEEQALGQLYGLLRPRLLKLAECILGGQRQDAEDIVHEAFMRAWLARERLQKPGSVAHWLAQIVRNQARTHLGRRGGVPLELACEPMDPAPTPVQRVVQAQQREALRGAVERLSPRQRQVVQLRTGPELPFAKIADQLGCSSNAARVNYVYGVRNLREALVA